jgi:hypothetical protein
MRNRAYLLVALLGLLTFALAPGIATAGQGKNLSEIALASGAAARAAAVSGPVISVSPLGHDYDIVNVGNSSSFTFTVSNTGDATLNVMEASSSSPSFTANVSGFVAPGGSTPMVVTYNPTSGVDESATITINSDASNGSFTVNVSGRGNVPPVLDPIGNKSANAFVNLSFTTTASDNGDQIDDTITFSVAPALPPGATYDTSSGEFSWTPGASDAGDHTLTFCTSDGFGSDCEVVTISVAAENNPPIAVAGGPYSGGTAQPITFSGTGSSDPDGDNLSYDWDFGDGQTGSGATTDHAYALAGNYIATLTVTDDGTPSLSSSDVASVQVLATLPASINTKLYGGAFRISGGGTQKIGMEVTAVPVTDINPATIRLSTTYEGAGSVEELAPDGKATAIGDLDRDGVPDLVSEFTRAALRTLLGNVPNNTVITLVMTAETFGGTPVQGTISVRIKGGAAAVSSFASPNPFNPETAISFTVRNSGPVSVRIYSIEGRLVKTLKDDFAQAGTHEVRWNGTDNGGRSVPSGMYFVKTESGVDKSIFKLSLLK